MKISTQFVKMISSFFGMFLLVTPITGMAQTKVVVIPLFGDDAKPPKNIITVAKANGNFTDPVAAVNSITDASADNPYLVVIGPGVYTISQTLDMKRYVDIVGSGENVTKIKGAINDNVSRTYIGSAIILGADDSTLSSLTVENTGAGYTSVALYSRAAPTIRNVTAVVSAGEEQVGIVNWVSSSPKMINVTAIASGGNFTTGVVNSSSSPTMTDVTVIASGGKISNIGIHNANLSPMMTNVSAKASGPDYNAGITNFSSSPTMINVTAIASGGKRNYGVQSSSSSPIIRRSTLQGSTNSLITYTGTATVSQSTLIGSIEGLSGGINKCVACDDGNGLPLDAACQPPLPPP